MKWWSDVSTKYSQAQDKSEVKEYLERWIHIAIIPVEYLETYDFFSFFLTTIPISLCFSEAKISSQTVPDFPLLPASKGFCLSITPTVKNLEDILSKEGMMPKEWGGPVKTFYIHFHQERLFLQLLCQQQQHVIVSCTNTSSARKETPEAQFLHFQSVRKKNFLCTYICYRQ